MPEDEQQGEAEEEEPVPDEESEEVFASDTRPDEWAARGINKPLRAAWTSATGPTSEQVAEFDRLSKEEQDKYFEVLAKDIGSAQRDALFYFNAIEQLKNEPTDEAADRVIENLGKLGLSSVQKASSEGGPPKQESPRPFRKVLGWLGRQLAKAGRFVLKAIAFLSTQLDKLGVSSVAVQIGFPFAISFGLELSPVLVRDNYNERWLRFRKYLDDTIGDMTGLA